MEEDLGGEIVPERVERVAADEPPHLVEAEDVPFQVEVYSRAYLAGDGLRVPSTREMAIFPALENVGRELISSLLKPGACLVFCVDAVLV